MSAQPRPRRWALGLLGAAAVLFVLALIVVGLANAGSPATTPSPSNDGTTVFLGEVQEDVDSSALLAMGKDDADVIMAAKSACVLREQGERSKRIAKEQALAPWIISGHAGHFVSAAIRTYCPDQVER